MVLLAAMLASMFSITAFAAGSVTSIVEVEEIVEYEDMENAIITSAEENSVTRAEVKNAIAELNEEEIAAFEEAGLDASKVSFTIISLKNIRVKTDKVAKVTVEVLKIKNPTIGVFLKNTEGNMKLLTVGKAPIKDIEIEESGTIVVVLFR